MTYMSKGETKLLNDFLSGNSTDAYKLMGSHPYKAVGKSGVVFRVWAPNAVSVTVAGDFNSWNRDVSPMQKICDEGVWEAFIEGAKPGDYYKYCVESMYGDRMMKSDPYAFCSEIRPQNASVVYDIEGYKWHDKKWYNSKKGIDYKAQPLNVYEVNAGSWKKNEDGTFLTYAQLADELVPYVKEMGYTHIEFMPLTEFPFDGSWGYQVTGYFSATSRYGSPKDLMYLIDKCHENGIGVILDWVPAHFPKDAHGLGRFDGTGCYEYEDPRIGEHKEWGTYIFNYTRYEVQSFLISSAMFWLDMYHIDGIRVDAVASMLYLNYNRNDGEWVANEYGGKENLHAVKFLQKLNKTVHEAHPSVLMIAEESTAWANVTGYPFEGYGLGFDFKWNMGWMNDTLEFIATDPLWRCHHQNELTFSMIYAYTESFMLPISHDEVTHGKCSLLNKMPGDYDNRFAGVRGYVSYMMAHPGKKLMFMGSEIGQFDEWDCGGQLEWNLLGYEKHNQLKEFFKDVNLFYKSNPPMYENDSSWDGFKWISINDWKNNVISFRRIDNSGNEIIVVCNFQPVAHEHYLMGVPVYGEYEEVFNSESKKYGGCGMSNSDSILAISESDHDLSYSVDIKIPPLGVIYLKLKKKLESPVDEATEEIADNAITDETKE